MLDKASMDKIVTDLERWYGVNITLSLNKPIKGLYSGEFDNEPLDIVLEGIGFSSGFKFKIDGKEVTIEN